jgi:redox-sensing transcriptional repressor
MEARPHRQPRMSAARSAAAHEGNSHSRPVPEACVTRLSWYRREVGSLVAEGAAFVSSRWLAKRLGLTDAQVRRDLSYFGQFGTSGRGYEVGRLHERLDVILGIANQTWNLALAGVGNLGSALLAHAGFRQRGFLFRLAVDADPTKIGRRIQNIEVLAADDLAGLCRAHRIDIGVIAVPAQAAGRVCAQFFNGGVRSILNFAPTRLQAHQTVRVRTVDLALEMEGLAFHLAREASGKA